MDRELQSINNNRPHGFLASLLAPVRIPWGMCTCIGVVAVLEYGIWRGNWYGWMPMLVAVELLLFCPPRIQQGLRTVSLVLILLLLGLVMSLPFLQPYVRAFKMFCLVMCVMVIPVWGAHMRRLAKQLDRS